MKVPITSIIHKWFEADGKLKARCEFEKCQYDSDSAYRGYILGFQDGINSQIDDNIKKADKADIVEAYRNLYKSGALFQLISEDDCVNYISNSQEYNFLAGALWMLNKLKQG